MQDPIDFKKDQREYPELNTNWLPWAIVSTLFCCQITGIVSIVFAAMANSNKEVNPEKAAEHNRMARLFFWIGTILGFVIIAVYLGIVIFAISTEEFTRID